MTQPLSETSYGDAPLSSAKNPDARRATNDGDTRADDVLVGRTVTINRPRHEVYAFWRDFANLPRFMQNVKSVRVLDSARSHWVIAAPGGQTVEWDSILTDDQPDELIAWRSDDDARIRNSGRVAFRDSTAGRGTEVTATIIYDPPLGTVGKLVAKLLQKEPKVQTRQDLRRFKQLLETGEVSTAQPPDAAPRSS